MKARFLVLSLFLLPFLPLPSSAATEVSAALSAQIEAVRREREALVEEQRKLQAELEKVTREGQNLGTAVKSLDTTRKKLASDIKVTQSRISSTDLNIKLLESNVSTAERQIGAHQRAISTAIQVLSERDSRSLVMDLLAFANFSEIWSDQSQLKELGAKLDQEVRDLRDTKEALTEEKERKERAKVEALSLQRELSGQKVVVEESQKAKERLLAETKNKEALYQQMLAENLRRQKEFEEDLFRLESELNIDVDKNLIPSAKRGLLAWPFDNAYIEFCSNAKNTRELRNIKCITQYYNYQPFKVTGNKGHNGMDFRAAVGTPIRTIASGVVQGTGNSDDQKNCYSYGRWILIKHKNGLSSIYAHLSSTLVKTGQSVGEGDLIGLSGGWPRSNGSGNSIGPHLHLGLFASQGVEIRPFTSERYLQTGIGCNKVMLPVVDLKAYLDPLAYLPSL